MKSHLLRLLAPVLVFGAPVGMPEALGQISLQRLGTYASGSFDAGAAEIVAHDPGTQRLFVVNAQAASVDVLSIQNPASPTKVGSIDLSSYGAVANSVAVRSGVVAVAVENAIKTEPGVVAFFDVQLNFIAKVTVGALPDMLAFTPNGRFLLVANEGEPSTDYTIDPEGSVSVIDMTGNLKKIGQDRVRTAGFSSFHSGNLDPKVRIFGPHATVAQDLEPEYIAISHDSKTAYVTCQENNAIATIDIESANVTALRGLGTKDHSRVDAVAEIHTFDPAALPSIGVTTAGQSIPLGGFSGLHFEGVDPVSGNLRFVTHTDRGPNAEPVGSLRPFVLPGFTPEIVRFEMNPGSGTLSITGRIPLQRSPGLPLTGLPNTAVAGTASTPYNDEIPVDLLGNILPLDPLGADLEGVVVSPVDGTFWMCDEYRPALYQFNASGALLHRYVPVGTAAAAGKPVGTFGEEVLPAILAQRRQNRGFEAIAFDGGRVYAFVQSPIRNPVSLGNSTLNGLRNVRVIEFNPATQATRQFVYVLDNSVTTVGTRADKIGDAVSFGNGEFLVIERDDDSVFNVADPGQIEKRIYRFNLTGASDVSSHSGLVGATGKTLEQLTVAELKANGIQPIVKILHVDLNAAGYNTTQKVEGLAMVDANTLAVINDNDFGVANITVLPDGSFVYNEVPESIQLGLVHVRARGLDASDSDGKNNIRQWPVKGLYMPDAIATYKIGNATYLVTANEGDVREWGTYQEAIRVGSGSVLLDPTRFPDASVLKNNANLGRLNISIASPRNPVTGVYEELHAFGARSFSIWDVSGALVFDSGDDLEQFTARIYPSRFNASNSNNTRDNRSDDKGPEPEGVVVGKVEGRDYAFIGLERIGGVAVYDISDPRDPAFVAYANNRDFSQPVNTAQAGDLGPEGLLFIKAEDSPTGRPLLVTGNEISGTTTVFEIQVGL